MASLRAVWLLIFAANCAQSLQPVAALTGTEDIECDGRRSVRSSTVVDPQLGTRAFAEVSLTPQMRNPRYCRTVWAIHIQSSTKGIQSRIASLITTEREGWGLQLEILGFVPNEDTVAVRLIRWAGDYTEYEILLAKTRTYRIRRLSLMKMRKAILRRTPDCPVWLYPVGLANRAELIIDAGASEDLEPGQKPCFDESRWILNPATGVYRPSPAARPWQLTGTVEK